MRCIYLDSPSNFKLFRSKNRSKISIFGGVMKMYILTVKLGYFFNFRSSIFPKFANFRNQILLYAKPILARILKIYATYQHQSTLWPNSDFGDPCKLIGAILGKPYTTKVVQWDGLGQLKCPCPCLHNCKGLVCCCGIMADCAKTWVS